MIVSPLSYIFHHVLFVLHCLLFCFCVSQFFGFLDMHVQPTRSACCVPLWVDSYLFVFLFQHLITFRVLLLGAFRPFTYTGMYWIIHRGSQSTYEGPEVTLKITGLHQGLQVGHVESCTQYTSDWKAIPPCPFILTSALQCMWYFFNCQVQIVSMRVVKVSFTMMMCFS